MSEHFSKPRNPNIASVFYKAGFIESWGRGISKIRNGFTAAGLPEPLFEESCGGIRVTMYRPEMPGSIKTMKNDGAEKERGSHTVESIDVENAVKVAAGSEADTETGVETVVENSVTEKTGEKTGEKILLLMSKNPLITYEEIARKLSMSKSGVGYAVRKLRKEGLIERVGPDKGGKWKVNR